MNHASDLIDRQYNYEKAGFIYANEIFKHLKACGYNKLEANLIIEKLANSEMHHLIDAYWKQKDIYHVF